MRCLREKKCDELQPCERVLAYLASRCEYAYGAMGKSGYLYESVKDVLKWHNMRPRHYAFLLMRIGDWMALDDERYRKEIVKQAKMSDEDIALKLKSMFGA